MASDKPTGNTDIVARRSLTQTATDGDRSSPSAPTSAARGDDIGRYLVVGEIGSGGLGQVVRGYDPDLNREVAIKLVRDDRKAGGDSARTRRSYRRLLREAQAIARLAHPNVVAVYEVDEHEGDVFIAMEYVRGLSLRDWLRRARDRDDILDKFTQAGQGLAAAHAANLVHRDFKPSNVLVGDDHRVRVADFGLARSFTETTDVEPETDLVSSPSDTVTVAGAVVGTPAYMAPEQLRGEEVDARADQFAFCLSLYEALTGERPRVGEGGRPLALTQLAKLPRHLVAPLRRGLSIDPAQRFPNMGALLERLPSPTGTRSAYVATVALLAAAAAGAVLLSRASHREPGCTAAGNMDSVWNQSIRRQVETQFASAALPGTAATTFDAFSRGVDRHVGAIGAMRVDNCRATRNRGEQSTELMDLRTSCLAQRTAELSALLTLLAEAPAAALIARTPEMVLRLPSVTACSNATQLRSAIALPAGAGVAARAARINRSLAQVRARIAAGQYKEAIGLALPAVAAARKLNHAPTLAQALQLHGEALNEQEKGKEAETVLREAALLADKGRDDATRASAYTLLINAVGVLQERKAEGAIFAVLARGVASRLHSEDLRAAVAAKTSRFHWWHGDFEQALISARGSVAIADRAFGPKDARTADASWVLGVIHSERREHTKAKPHLEKALRIYTSALGESHIKVGKALNSLAIVHFDLGLSKDAEALYRRALAVFNAAGAPALRRAMTVMNLGNSLSRRGAYGLALAEYKRAEAIIVDSVGKKHSRYADLLQNTASTLSKMGRHTEALAALDVAVKIRLDRFGRKHPITAATMRTIGNTHLRANQPDKALARFREAVKVLEAAKGPNNPMLLRALIDIGELQLKRKSLQAAKRTLERGEAIAIAHPDSHTPALLGNFPDFLSEVLWLQNDRSAARAAAKRALVLYRTAKRTDHIRRLEAFLATGRVQPR